MANAWRRDNKAPKFLTPKSLTLTFAVALIFLLFYYLSLRPNPTFTPKANNPFLDSPKIPPFDCLASPQAHPIVANLVEGLTHPFIYSLSDFGSLPDKPHKNIVRLLKGKPFRKPDISATIQEVLGKLRNDRKDGGGDGYVVDVGANVGMASFAAAVMGFRVLSFEPVMENLQRICDGVWLNRVGDLVTVFPAAASDRDGNITFHKLVGRLDNSAVSATGAKLAFKSNEEIELQVRSIPLGDMISDSTQVLLMKIDVQGWEFHVLKGASKLLSRKGNDAPYLIYEEDERLLQASNSSAKEIRDFLHTVGYHHCTQHGTFAANSVVAGRVLIVKEGICNIGSSKFQYLEVKTLKKCSQNKGTGVNSVDHFNGQFKACGLCWLCGGKREILCGNCNGAGFIGRFMSTPDE